MNHAKRIELAKRCLKGISIGDAFGESFFGPSAEIEKHINDQSIPQTSWEFTDDTVMAIAVLRQLIDNGSIEQDELAKAFSKNHEQDPNRGYGATVRSVLRGINEGQDWRGLSKAVFDGMGSMGNGAAMRVGPIGAYYFEDLEKLKLEAAKSAEVTHANQEAISGAIAVATATALAAQMRIGKIDLDPMEFLDKIILNTPDSDTKAKINKAKSLPYSYSIDTLKTVLGNGSKMMAQDTVPFCLWCAAYNLENLESALWKAISILGDRDTICAIVGGIVILSCDEETIPADWSAKVEDYRTSLFYED